MGDIVPMRRQCPHRLSAAEFQKEVRRFVQSDAVVVLRHLRRDHPERRVSLTQIYKCLEMGTVQEGPFLNSHGNWQSTLFRHMAGEPLTVVAAIEWDKNVLVITAY